MQKTLIIYESKYGSTEKIAKDMALIVGPAKYCRTNEFKDEYKNFDFFVIGSPVYKEKVDEKIVNFIKDNLHWLQKKKTAIFCVCSAGKYGVNYLKQLNVLLGKSLVYEKVLGGDVVLDKLSKEDYDSMMAFYKKFHQEPKDIKTFDLKDVIDFALNVKEIKEKCTVRAPENIIKQESEKFIKSHDTCTLATGHDKKVRSTPIEYNYKDGDLYFITEGGEKFANILQNNNVSISIYEPFTAMNNLKGMQIEGEASIVEYKSKEYYEVLQLKNLKEEQLEKFPAILNVLKVKINKIEFLYSEFQNMGYSCKQILDY